VVQRGTVDQLPEFHRLYVETAERSFPTSPAVLLADHVRCPTGGGS
jgi:hypothetical protein